MWAGWATGAGAELRGLRSVRPRCGAKAAGVCQSGRAWGRFVLSSVCQTASVTRAWCRDGSRAAFNSSARRRALELSMKAFRIGLPGAISCHSNLRFSTNFRTAFEVNAVPLSLTTFAAGIEQGCQFTRPPDNEVPAIRARHSRGQPSTTVMIRNRRPSVGWSATKSNDQRRFGISGSPIGGRVPRARLRPPRLLLSTADAKQVLVIGIKARAPKNHMQPTIAEPASDFGQFLQPRAQHRVILTDNPIAHGLPATADHTARPPRAHPVALHQMRDRLPLRAAR